ncbi:MAG: hypothetical protein KJ653_01910 [Candidatus Thermoplasmatota archaeon]|nr:hypothetical protein [Candidatus Thermoplasmatota archaeon]
MAAKSGTSSLLTAITRESIIEAEMSWVASMVLFFSTVYTVLKLDVLWVAFGIAAISLYVLPIISTRNPFRALPWEMTLLLAAPLLLHISSGSRIMLENFGWWRHFTDLAFAFSLATIGFLLTVELGMYTDVRMNRPFAIFFVVMFTLGISGLWQVGEYVGDVVNGTHNLTSNRQVMMSFVWVLVGGMLMGLVYDFYLKAMSEDRKRTLGFIHLWEVPKWKKD